MGTCRFSVCLSLALAVAGWSLAPGARATIELQTEAVCIDDGAVKNGIEGGLPVGTASCNYSVNRGGFNRRDGSVTGSAQALAPGRSVGVDVTTDASLTTAISTVFGANAIADARINDTFIVTGSLPLGTPISNGLMQINALATGQIRLDGDGAATVNTRALLHFGIAVGSESRSFTELIFLHELAPGEIRFINVPFVIPAMPFLGAAAIPINMFARAELVAELTDDGAIDGRIQFGNSLDWLGITNVTDSLGNPAASFTAISPGTGTDWGAVTAVPEPRAALLILVAAVLVLAAARRRRPDPRFEA